MDTLECVIAKASEMCGSQNELGRRIGISSANLTSMKKGRQPMPKEKVAAVAAVVDMPAADLWLIAQDARNPFKASAPGVLSVMVSAVLAGVLSLTPFSESRAATGTYSTGHPADRMHIVISNRLRRLFARRRRTAPA